MSAPSAAARAAALPAQPVAAAVEAALERFEPVTLEAVGDAALMNRVDTKFLVPAAAVPSVLERLVERYRVLDVRGVRLARYWTRYFDTPALALYHAHHAGRLPRHKVRIRAYLETGERYLEVKLKSNKGRTHKTRTLLESPDAPLARVRETALAGGVDAGLAEALQATLTASFVRLTLVRRDAPERLTVDLGVSFTRGAATRAFPALAIVEIKQERHGSGDARDALRALYVRDAALSKYCLGIATLEPAAKKNRFKPVLSVFERAAGGG